MLVKVKYAGFYPLGADVEFYNVPIMKAGEIYITQEQRHEIYHAAGNKLP